MERETQDTAQDKIKVEVAAYLENIMPIFLTNRQTDLIVLDAALAQHDWATIRKIAHDLHGNGAGYSLPHITDLGIELGQTANAGQSSEVKAHLEALRDYLERLEISFKPQEQ